MEKLHKPQEPAPFTENKNIDPRVAIAVAANTASLTGREIAERLRIQGKPDEANAVFDATKEITKAILQNGK